MSLILLIEGGYFKLYMSGRCAAQYACKHPSTEQDVSLCSDSVAIITRWCEVAMQYGQGRVSHAVAGCMRSLLQDWHLMVTQLEHQLLTGHLTLQVSLKHACTCPIC